MEKILSEHQEQVRFFQLARELFGSWPMLRLLLFAIPNGGQRHKAVALKMRAEGQKSGIPDICCAIPVGGFHGLYIEMKRRKGGALSKTQSLAIDELKRQGYAVAVCRGADEAMQNLSSYLEGKHAA